MTKQIEGSEEKEAQQTKAALSRAKKAFPRSGHLMEAFLEDYEKTENQSLTGTKIGVGITTVSLWKKNEDFMACFTVSHIRAQQKNNDNLRSSGLQRAINGSPHYLIKAGQIVRDEQGNPVIAYREFETDLTKFFLKNRLPDEFREKFEHEISGQLIVTLASEFIAIVRRNAPPAISNAIEKELETLSAKLATT